MVMTIHWAENHKYSEVSVYLSIANKNRVWMKGLVFIGLLTSVTLALLTGMALEGSMEAEAGNIGAIVGSGGGSAGIHAIFAGLIALFLLLHLVVNRKTIMFTLKSMVKEK